MKSALMYTSLSTLLALGLLTGCNEKTTEAPAPEAEVVETSEAVTIVEPVTAVVVNAEPATGEEKPFIAMTDIEVVTAMVKAINHETRDVTLTVGEEEISFVASEAAHNLDQVQVGDQVVAEYMHQVTLELVDGEGLEAGEGAIEVAERAAKGEQPGLVTGETQIKVFMVDNIDLEANTFTLKNASGEVKQYTARNPENLKRAKVGDALVATVTDMVAIEVNKAPAES